MDAIFANRIFGGFLHWFASSIRLESSPPYLRELILFAVNTGLRCGDLLDLKWEDVDIEEKRISLIMGKTRRRIEIPLNETASAILAGKQAVAHGPYVFYNPVTVTGFAT